MVLLTIGGLLVAGLVVWALTRTVEAPTSVTEGWVTDSVATAPASTPVLDTSATASATTATVPPTTTAPLTVTTPLTPPPVQGERGSVARIAVEDLRERVKGGNVAIIDVRDAASYQAAHIPGSINIPFASIESQINLVPKGKEIVLYCT